MMFSSVELIKLRIDANVPREPEENSEQMFSNVRHYPRHPESLIQQAIIKLSVRHAWPCAGHPRSLCCPEARTWMAGTSPAMTESANR
ncbi:hypothetical protein [Bradyrhizobium sp. AZCC 2289]|uniref:hypothetical protein n=1 Tax=Bradyrhizobium sp. AZCC 2289 TaxID=3117026 RepID=UPI002FF1C68E